MDTPLTFPAWLALSGAILAAVWLAGGWRLSSRIRRRVLEPRTRGGVPPLEVLRVEPDRVTLGVLPETGSSRRWRQEGLWGLRWPGGHAQAGRILHLGKRQVTRRLRLLNGVPASGTRAMLTSFAFPDDPEEAFGLPVQPLRYHSPLGRFPAWLTPGTHSTWVIFVHGKRGAPPSSALRSYPLLKVASDLGFPGLVISYRNDLEAEPAEDGLHWCGLTEWEDLEGAVRHALEAGAEGLILAGYSMGGSVVMSFLQQSHLARSVRGVVLEAPVLDLGATLDFAGRNRGYPRLFSHAAKTLAQVRFGVPWKKLNYIRSTDYLQAPTLIFHGGADTLVPLRTSQLLARSRPDLVRFETFPGATHGRSWNLDPNRYERIAREFLESTATFRRFGRRGGAGFNIQLRRIRRTGRDSGTGSGSGSGGVDFAWSP